MTESDSLERLLDLARAEFSPSAADKSRTRAALHVPGQAGAASPVAAQRSWQALRASGKAGLLTGVLLLGGGVAAGYWLGQRAAPGMPSALAPAVALEPQLVATEAPPPTNPVPQALPAREAKHTGESLARAPVVRVSARRRATSAAAPAAIEDELSLLRRVERALRASDPAFALALLAELDERFPHTSLAEERHAAAVMAHCGLGEAGAVQRARSFLRDRSESVYAERVRAACALPPARERSKGSAASGDE